VSAVLDYLPRGNTLSDEEWQRRHKLLQWLLAAHIPALFLFGVLRGFAVADVAETLALPLAALIVGHLLRSRRLASTFVTLGLVYCSAALVGFSDGAIEAHFHFFIIIGFIALYQDWVPFLLNILFTVLSHGIGSSFVPDLMFNHISAQQHPWEWSLIHGVAVLAACAGVVLFWKTTEDEQGRSLTLTQQLADAEIGRRRFTSDLLVNLARRNQNLLYRQLQLLNELEDKEHDPDALGDLFRLDHLATRIRRNAESLLVLSGEESPRTWREPVQLVDVVRAAIAEIEDLDRVDEAIDETLSVSGRSVADLTHLFAELLENAVHFSPPGVTVVVRSRPLPSSAGTHLVTIEDWGVGMTPQELAEANVILRTPGDVDLSVSQRLGLHVVARLAHRYGITVELTPTPGGGVTAVAVLPPVVFARAPELVGAATASGYGAPGFPPPARGVASGYGTPPAGTPVVPATPVPATPVVPMYGAPVNGTPVNGTARPVPPSLGSGATGTMAPPPLRAPGPNRPVPPLPADLGGPQLPRRGPGEALHRSRLGHPTEAPAPADHASPPAPADRDTGPQPTAPADPATAARPTVPGDRSTGPQPAAAADGGRPADLSNGTRPATPAQNGMVAAGTGAGPQAPVDGGVRPPAPFRGPVPGGDGAAQPGSTDTGWSSWWTRATAPDGEPDPRRPHPDEPAPNGNGNGQAPPEPIPLPEPRPPADDDGPQLHRRVPQANLAAGLRRDGEQPAHEETPVVRDPLAARNALSRFQAAQRAARDQVDGEHPESGPT
jgi:signal transduction histidine kinase